MKTAAVGTTAAGLGHVDILETVIPSAKKRREITKYCWSEDVWRTDVPNVKKCQEVDLSGRRARTLCLNNSGYANFLLRMQEDFTRSYDIGGTGLVIWRKYSEMTLANLGGSEMRFVS